MNETVSQLTFRPTCNTEGVVVCSSRNLRCFLGFKAGSNAQIGLVYWSITIHNQSPPL